MIKSVMLRFDKFLHETEKAYLVRVGNSEYWLPRKLCMDLITNKKLGGNVIMPTFLYERIFGVSVSDMSEYEINNMANTIIEKHIPTRIEPVNISPDKSLIK